ALMLIWFEPYADPTRVYFGTDTRASGLLLGAALALVWRPWERSVPDRRTNRLGGLGLVAIVGLGYLLATLGEFTPRTYQGGFFVVSALTCVAVGAAAIPGSWFGRLLGSRPLRIVGVRSYALYLVHWPIVVYTRPGIDLDLPAGQILALRLVLMVALTEAAHQLIEVPIRKGRLTLAPARRLRLPTPRVQLSERGAVAALGLVVALAAGASLALAFDRPDQIDPSQPTALASTTRAEVVPTSSTKGLAPPEPPDLAVIAPVGPDEIEAALPPLDIEDVQRALVLPMATEHPTAETPPTPDLVLLIGDSVARGADEALQAELGETIIVDAAVSRQFHHTIDVLGAYLDDGLDPSTVVVHLGTNGALTDEQVDEVAAMVGAERNLVLVTVLAPRPWQDVSNKTLAKGAARWCNAQLVDWRALADESPDWIGSDGVHLTATGADAYARMLFDGLPTGYPTPVDALGTVPPTPNELFDCE
ncbi:MAG: acyltransferase, partial [Actinomycetia bacterium]|nr:acyltransferase [Actinomycetes bacterium]